MKVFLNRRSFVLGLVGTAVTLLAAPVGSSAATNAQPVKIGCGRMNQVDLRKFYVKAPSRLV
jgi:hypothetical protein